MNSEDETGAAAAVDDSMGATKPTRGGRRKTRKGRARRRGRQQSTAAAAKGRVGGTSDYPRHPVRKALRIPRAILEQNAGRACTDREAASFSGMGYHGPFRVELSSVLKYGFLSRPAAGKVEVTDLGKKVLRPQNATDEVAGIREAVLRAPKISDVYKHYRGENIPDEPFFGNALVDTFGIPPDKHEEFKAIFLESLEDSALTETHNQKRRVVVFLRAPESRRKPRLLFHASKRPSRSNKATAAS
jgi:hypothetical protein